MKRSLSLLAAALPIVATVFLGSVEQASAATPSMPMCNKCITITHAYPYQPSESWSEGTKYFTRTYNLTPQISITATNTQTGANCVVSTSNGLGKTDCAAGTYRVTFGAAGLGTLHDNKPMPITISYTFQSGPLTSPHGFTKQQTLTDGTTAASGTFYIGN